MHTLLQDLRYAARTLVKSPGFALPAILTLALGIGANTAVFSVVNGVLLRPLPYPQPERLVYIGWTWPSGGTGQSITAFKYAYVREHARSFEGVSTERAWATEIGGDQNPDEARGVRATADFFRVNGIQPALGRAFSEEETRRGAPAVAVLSDAVWRTRFDADPAVLGRTVRLGGDPHTVVGVLPPGVDFPETPGYADFVVPYILEPDPRDEGQNYLARARLRPGVTVEQAEAELRAVTARFREEHPDLAEADEIGFALLRYQDIFVGGLERTLWILLGAVALVLLIACVNVANLMLARATGRHRELAVRAALGAGRGRIVRRRTSEIGVRIALGALPRQVEGLVVAGSLKLVLAGLAGGAAAALLLTRLLRGLLYGVEPTHPAAYLAAALLLAGVALCASWLPARRAARVDPVDALRAE